MKKIAAIFASTVAAAAFAAPAHAASGQWTQAEWYDICFTGATCTATNISQAEDLCNCTGDLTKTWTDTSGQDHRRYKYNNSYETGGVTINFRLNTAGTKWLATDSSYCAAGGCIYGS